MMIRRETMFLVHPEKTLLDLTIKVI